MSSPQNRASIRQHRRERADGGQPLNTETRSLFPKGGSIAVTLTAYARDTHSLNCKQNVTIEVHPDGIWIAPEDEDE